MKKIDKKYITHVKNESNRLLNELSKMLTVIRNVVWMFQLKEMFESELKIEKNKHFYKTMTMEGHASKHYMVFSYFVVSLATCLDDGGITRTELCKYYDGDSSVIEEIKQYRNYVCHFNPINSMKMNNQVGHRQLLESKSLFDIVAKVFKVSDAIYKVAMDRQRLLHENTEKLLELYQNELQQTSAEYMDPDLLYILMNAKNDEILSGKWITRHIVSGSIKNKSS
jgi:arginine/lysine/ornithine decarboxylase